MPAINWIEVQKRLAEMGHDPGPIDGILGRKTRAAVRQFQRRHGLSADGIVGPKTKAELFPAAIPERDMDPPPSANEGKRWPRQRDVARVFGQPGGAQCTAGKVHLPFKFRIAWNKRQYISQFSCHENVAQPFERIFAKAHEEYGEAKMRALGLDLFGGCYNFRRMRGGRRYSMHSWGIAVDLDPARNQLRWKSNRAQFAKPIYEPFWRIVEGEGALSLGRARDFDWMHFQFARL